MKKIVAVIVGVLFMVLAFSSVIINTTFYAIDNEGELEVGSNDVDEIVNFNTRAKPRIPYTTRTHLELSSPSQNDTFGYLDDVEVKGILYEDFNGNGSFDDGEDFPIPDAPIHVFWGGGGDNQFLVYTNEEGNFSLSIKNEEKFKGPSEVQVEYFGEYTVNGSVWFEAEQKLGFNDDGDWWFDMNASGDHDQGDGVFDAAPPYYDIIVDDVGLFPSQLDSGDIIKRDLGGYAPNYYATRPNLDGELIDEEFPNGDDDDGDWKASTDDLGEDGLPGTADPGEGDGVPGPGEPNVDEDLNYTFFRKSSGVTKGVLLYHQVDITYDVMLNGKVTERVTVGDTITIKGRLKDVIDPTASMNNLPVKFEVFGTIPPDLVRTDFKGDFNYSYTIPDLENLKVGKRSVKVIFDPEHWEPGSEYYLYQKTEEKFIRVYRNTFVEFEKTGDDAVGYLYKPIIINGSIKDNNGNPLTEKVSHDDGTDETILPDAYRLFFEWGTEMDRFYEKREFDIATDGSFSINYIVSDPYQELGPVTVTISITTNLTQTYYQPCSGSNTFKVRGFTEMDLWIDQDKDGYYNEVVGKNKEGPTADFITRLPYKDSQGNTHNWQIIEVYGRLYNKERPTEGIDGMEVYVWWDDTPEADITGNLDPVSTGWIDLNGNGKEDDKEDGMFKYTRTINVERALGPITTYAQFDSEGGYFDSAYSQKTFNVVAMTKLKMLSTDVIKGENATFKGKLMDDRDTGIPNQNLSLYWEDREGDLFSGSGDTYKFGGLLIEPTDKYDEFKLQDHFIGTVMTDGTGYFEFSAYEVPADKSVGVAYIVAIYSGSKPPYTVSDSFIGSDSNQIPINVTAYTIIDLKDKFRDIDFTRGDSFQVEGELVEEFDGKENEDYPVILEEEEIEKITVWIGLGSRQLPAGAEGDNTVKIRDFKKGQFTYNGEIPRELSTGIAPLELSFEGTKKYLPSNRITYHLIWTDTYFEIFLPEAIEIEGSGNNYAIKDIRENEFNNKHDDFVEPGLRFTIGLYERGAAGDTQMPVDNATVWFNISSEESVFINYSVDLTDSLGLVTFTFDKPLIDSDWGHTLGTTFSEALNITITFQGGQYRRPTQVNILTTHHPAPEGEERSEVDIFIEDYLIWVIIAIIIFLVVFFFIMSWYRKQQRIRGIKRIIKRAADQLIAGNEYTYVIFKSYQKLGAHLRKYGYLRRESETFREFEDAVRSALPIDRLSMDKFLGLLEEARYSSHDIGEDQRNKAIVNLRNIERSLERIIIDEKSALQALERLEEEEMADTHIEVGGAGTVPSKPSMPPLLKGAGKPPKGPTGP